MNNNFHKYISSGIATYNYISIYFHFAETFIEMKKEIENFESTSKTSGSGRHASER